MDRVKKLKEIIINRLEKFLFNLLLSLEKFKDIPIQQNNSLNLVDLTPNDAVDNCDVYFEAIVEGLQNPKAKNIALTGPYGSGKSSIIKSFEKKYPRYKFLNISLASFKEDTESLSPEQQNQQDRLIERSIIQQMFYGADSSKLSHSRFKRIKVPNPIYSFTKACLIGVWCLFATMVYYAYPFDILNLANSWAALLSSITALSFLFAIPTVFLSDYLKSQNSFNFKKVSLKNLEIEASECSENSILNRHLDEIIYFFQVANDYDLVVIEDLDRFGSPDIFVKLREINKLINENDGTSGNIKFLYALKDDMFVHKNRAKFFDLIIPVIPVVNSSNALDRILTSRLKDSTIDVYEKIKRSSFLREVSNYLDDMRLIHNIFNEFEIYYNKLKDNTPDPIKLLAVIIYKNVYPNDFESLHHGNGALAALCNRKTEILDAKKELLLKEIQAVKQLISASKQENLNSVSQLINLYLGVFSLRNNGAIAYYQNNSNNVTNQLTSITTIEGLNELLNKDNLLVQNTNSNRTRVITTFKQIKDELDPNKTLKERENDIINKSAEKQQRLRDDIKVLEQQIAKLQQLKLADLLQLDTKELDLTLISNTVDEHGKTVSKPILAGDNALFRYLILDGHLDENYYLYSSNFYEGRKTRNDQNFITMIRSHTQPEPAKLIDNPKEVCSELRESDFSHSYILNIYLIDYLIKSNQSNRLKQVFQYINHRLTEIDEFFAAYFANAKHLDIFIKKYAEFNPLYASTVVKQKINNEHLRQILMHVDIDFICSKMNQANVISNYLSNNLEFIVAGEHSGIIEHSVCKRLGIKVTDVSLLVEHEGWYLYLIDNQLYEINVRNICHLLANEISKVEDIKTCNYTSIQTSDLESLKSYIEQNITDYFDNVFLQLESNTDESEASIIKLLNNDKLSDSQKNEVILRQSTVIEDCGTVPQVYWLEIAEEEKMAATWENIAKLWESEVADKEVLIKLFNQTYYSKKLSEADWPKTISNDTKKAICSLIYESDDISDKNYTLLTSNFPWQYLNFSKNVNENKLNILVNNKVISFNIDSFEYAKDYDFFINFILINIDVFIKNKDIYEIESNTIKQLLISDITDKYKTELVYLLNWNDIDESGDLKLASVLAILFQKHDIELAKIDNELMQWICYSNKDINTAIELILKFIEFWDEDGTFNVLGRLPEPYCNISNYGKRPKIDKTDLNLKFAKALHRRHFISSMPVEDFVIQINTKKNRR